MTTSQRMSLQSVISREDVKLKPAQLGYLQGRAQSKAQDVVLRLLMELASWF
jgi:hypothetical protein